MSVPTNTAKVQYTLSAGAQALPVPFYFLDDSHVKVVRARSGVADLTKLLESIEQSSRRTADTAVHTKAVADSLRALTKGSA